MPDYMTTDEAAEFLRTPRATLYAWRHRGGGPPAVKVGRRLLFRRSDLEGWLDDLAKAS